MLQKSNFMNRRNFVRLGLSSTTFCFLPLFSHGSSWKSQSANLKITVGKRTVGLKISADSKGNVMASLRELNKKKMLVIPLGKPKGNVDSGRVTSQFKLRDGTRFSVFITREGVVSSDMKGVSFGDLEYPSGEGFFGWLKGVVNDVVAVVGAAITFLTGQWGAFKLSSGGSIYVEGGNGMIEYDSGAGGFKLEPGLEENPNIWY